mmetsp:Transcript_65435/g.173429  ORF Transcript_65435/g.173429 Transcript_65435/m.173429 type:complete len:218 (-) Transcript_65435:1338-1991(-)
MGQLLLLRPDRAHLGDVTPCSAVVRPVGNGAEVSVVRFVPRSHGRTERPRSKPWGGKGPVPSCLVEAGDEILQPLLHIVLRGFFRGQQLMKWFFPDLPECSTQETHFCGHWNLQRLVPDGREAARLDRRLLPKAERTVGRNSRDHCKGVGRPVRIHRGEVVRADDFDPPCTMQTRGRRKPAVSHRVGHGAEATSGFHKSTVHVLEVGGHLPCGHQWN